MIVPTLKKVLEEGLVWVAEPAKEKFSPVEVGESPFSSLVESAAAMHVAPQEASRAAKFGVKDIDEELPGGGLKSGGVHQFVPKSQKKGALPDSSLCSIPSFLAARYLSTLEREEGISHFSLWIGKDAWPTPFFLQQIIPPSQHALLSRCVFIDPPSQKSALWSIEAALRTKGIAVVVAESNALSLGTSRRLALAARAHGALCLLVCPRRALTLGSAALSVWEVGPYASPSDGPRWELAWKRMKGGQPRSEKWVVEFSEEHSIGSRGSHDSRAAVSLRLPSDVGNQRGGESDARVPAGKFKRAVSG